MRTERSRRSAARAVLIVAVLTVPAFSHLRAAAAGPPDPYELYEAATRSLARGDLDGAGALLADLRALITATPEWDPDGAFARDLLPILEGRVVRILAALDGLEEWAGSRLDGVRPPAPAADADTLSAYTGWASGMIGRIQTEAEERLGAELGDPEDLAVLRQSTRYETARRRLEAEVLLLMSEAVQEEMDRILARDERSEALQTRLESVKRSTVDLAVERGEMEEEIARYRQQAERYRKEIDRYVEVLADLIGEGTGGMPGEGGDPIGSAFSRLLDNQIDTVESRGAQTPAEKSKWRRNLGRYRYYNGVLTAARIATDQSQRLAALEAAVERSPVAGLEPTPPPPSLARHFWLPLAVLTFTAAFLGWLAARIRRHRDPAPSEVRRPDRPADRNPWR